MTIKPPREAIIVLIALVTIALIGAAWYGYSEVTAYQDARTTCLASYRVCRLVDYDADVYVFHAVLRTDGTALLIEVQR